MCLVFLFVNSTPLFLVLVDKANTDRFVSMNAKCNWQRYSDNKIIKIKVNIIGIAWKHAAEIIFTLLALHLQIQMIWAWPTAKIKPESFIIFACCTQFVRVLVLNMSSTSFYFRPLFCHMKDKKVTSPSSLYGSFCSWKQHYPKFPCEASILQRRTRVSCPSQTTSIGSSMLVPVRHACQTGDRGQMLCWNVLKMTPSCCS